jgi:formyl-CoA transferase
MLADPHFAAREAIVTVDDPAVGRVSMQNVFPRLSATPGRVRHTGRTLGQDNDEVYGRLLGLSMQRLSELKHNGTI